MKQALPYFHLSNGYRRFAWPWWREKLSWLWSGWRQDLYTFWHRGRYGWAPRDTWNLDTYLAKVLGGSLQRLADHKQGSPIGYPYNEPHVLDGKIVRPATQGDDPDIFYTDHDQWKADLSRWAKSFEVYARDDLYELHGHKPDYKDWNDDERRRYEEVLKAWKDIGPWFGNLWD